MKTPIWSYVMKGGYHLPANAAERWELLCVSGWDCLAEGRGVQGFGDITAYGYRGLRVAPVSETYTLYTNPI